MTLNDPERRIGRIMAVIFALFQRIR